MISLALLAEAQIANMIAHYLERGRPEAANNLRDAVAAAMDRIDRQRGPFFSAPRPYPNETYPGWRWLKAGAYWIAFSGTSDDFRIHVAFHESANIPGRMPR